MGLIKYVSSSPQETKGIGRLIARELPQNGQTVLCLMGEMGVGKTTFIKAFVSELIGIAENEIHSPTFHYLNMYQGSRIVYHFDCYRLKDSSDFLSRGFDEMFEEVCLIEWPEKIKEALPKKRHVLAIEWMGKNRRMLVYETDPI